MKDVDNGLWRLRLLAILLHRKKHADHPAFPGEAYPTVREELNRVWLPLIDSGYAEQVSVPRLAVRITIEGEQALARRAAQLQARA